MPTVVALSPSFCYSLLMVARKERLPYITVRDVRLESEWLAHAGPEQHEWLTKQMTSIASRIAKPYSQRAMLC